MTMIYPSVSVVIPTFNRAHYLVLALKSVLEQDYSGFIEVLIVDDGSTDETNSVIQQFVQENYLNRKVTYLFQENKGSNIARNLGIHFTQCEWIGFLDSDDLWRKNKLSSQIQFLNNIEFKCDTVYCGWEEIDENGNLMDVNGIPQDKVLVDTNRILIKDHCGPTSTILIRRSSLLSIGQFNPQLKARQDWELSIRILLNTQVQFMKEFLVYYRNHQGVRTYSNSNNEIESYLWILKNHVKNSNIGFGYKLQSWSNFYKRKARVNVHYQKNFIKANLNIFKSILIWPFNLDHYFVLIGIYLSPNLRRNIHLKWNRLILLNRFQIKSH